MEETMNGKIIFSFVAGVASGAATAWFITKRKYEALNEEDAESFRNGYKKLNEEIKSLREELKTFKKEDNAQGDQEDPAQIKKRGDEIVESVLESVKAIQEQHKYKNYSDSDKSGDEDPNSPVSKEPVKKRIDIEKITEDIFNEPNSEFEKCGITLYMDAIFTDDDDKEMSDGYLSETIGIDIKDELIDSEKVGTVYVRNHKTGKDYEILCIDETWNDVHNVE